LVRENRAKKAEYYKSYDRDRFQNDPRVRERHTKYQATEAGKASITKAKKKYLSENPIKRGAVNMVNDAVRDGRLYKSDCCSECGANAGRIYGHHDDYAYPMIVRWLCSECHTQWHKLNGTGLNG